MILSLNIQGWRIWLPIVLLWPLVLAAFFLVGLFTFQPFRAVAIGFRFLCSLRGLQVDVNNKINFQLR